MSLTEPSFTFGIEEEYHLVDIHSRDLAEAPPALMTGLERALGSQVSPEFARSQVEVGTRPCRTAAEARSELLHLRSTIARLANEHGLAPIAVSTHPFAEPEAVATTEKQRYRELARDLAGVGR